MYLLDASSILHAWDNYPVEQFPPLWGWLAAEMANKSVKIPKVAFDEASQKSPDCGQWLTEAGIEVIPLSDAILHEALAIKRLLGIRDDQYHPKGVGENDLLIIATCKRFPSVLVSDEGRQARLPDVLSKCKIPAVCGFPQVGVECILFIEFIKRSGVVFAR